MLRWAVVASLLLCLGLFAQTGVASTDTQAVYAASDYSALAPPGVIAPNSVQTEILNFSEIKNRHMNSVGGSSSAGLNVSYAYIAPGPQRQDFL